MGSTKQKRPWHFCFRTTGWWCGVLLLCILRQGSWAQSASADQVEAAYLYNFAKLTEWPRERLAPTAPLTIGVLDRDDDFVNLLSQMVNGKTAGAHPIAVRRVTSTAEMSSCAMVFFRAAERKHVATAIASLVASDPAPDGPSILLVGEDEGFLRVGGMINLTFGEGKIRFEVNREALAAASLRLSPNLLSLARTASPSSPEASAQSRKLIANFPPEYPELARRLNLRGTVQLLVIVAKDGSVKDAVVKGGHPLLADALSKAVMGWKYAPASQETTEIVKYDFSP